MTEPFPDAMDFGRSLKPGIGFNILSRDVARSVEFAVKVLGAVRAHATEDFAALTFRGALWMVHADRTYRNNALTGILQGAETRGAGVELRLYDCDPDRAEAAARANGFTVLAGSIDKPHGLRECVLLDDDGYAWVPGRTLP